MMKCLEILINSARKVRKKPENSGIGPKFHCFISFFQSYPYALGWGACVSGAGAASAARRRDRPAPAPRVADPVPLAFASRRSERTHIKSSCTVALLFRRFPYVRFYGYASDVSSEIRLPSVMKTAERAGLAPRLTPAASLQFVVRSLRTTDCKRSADKSTTCDFAPPFLIRFFFGARSRETDCRDYFFARQERCFLW